MFFLKLISVLLGMTSAWFGYSIYFKKRYDLINGFEDDFEAGRKTERFAKNLGLIEFVAGIVLTLGGIALFVFA